MKVTIPIEVEVRDQREADSVKTSLEHFMGLNGASGILNLYDELKNNMVVRGLVGAVVKKVRKS